MPIPLFNKLKEKKMYRTIKRTPTSLNVNETMEGETIEKMIEKGGSKKQIETMSNFIQPEFFKYSDDYYPVNILKDYPNCSNK